MGAPDFNRMFIELLIAGGVIVGGPIAIGFGMDLHSKYLKGKDEAALKEFVLANQDSLVVQFQQALAKDITRIVPVGTKIELRVVGDEVIADFDVPNGDDYDFQLKISAKELGYQP